MLSGVPQGSVLNLPYIVWSWQVCQLHPLPIPFIIPFLLSHTFPHLQIILLDLEILPNLP